MLENALSWGIYNLRTCKVNVQGILLRDFYPLAYFSENGKVAFDT